MKVYLAARYSRRDELLSLIPKLKKQGIQVTSSWLRSTGTGKLPDRTAKENRKHAIKDFKDIERAHAVMMFSEDPGTPTPRGGRHVELGYALGLGKLVIVIGPHENVFHFHPNVEVYATLDAYLFG